MSPHTGHDTTLQDKLSLQIISKSAYTFHEKREREKRKKKKEEKSL